MKTLYALTVRNVKLFFKDKASFFASLIAPLILLFLFVVFLGDVYRDIAKQFIEGVPVGENFLDGFVGGWLFSSLIAVSAVTVAFSANMIMVQDKTTGARNDFMISPVKRHILAISYYLATLFVTLVICYVALIVGFIYLACVGWYLSVFDVFEAFLDVFLLVMFGTALSSIVNFFLSTQGQIAAVSTIISAGYGFICGAYMPISNFASGIQHFVSLLPGTYGTCVLRNTFLRGAVETIDAATYPQAAGGLKAVTDMNISFFGNEVGLTASYITISISVVVLIAAYVLLNIFLNKKQK